MICPSCGGEYADWAQKCPYCGSVNEKADERLYLNHLEELRRRLDVVDEESEVTYRRQVSHQSRRLLKPLVVLLGAVLLIFCVGMTISTVSKNRQEERQLDQLEWEREEFPRLDAWYEAGEYDAILEENNRLLTDLKNNYSLYGWAHYTYIFDFYQSHLDVQRIMSELDSGETPDAYSLAGGIYSALHLRCETTEDYLARLQTTFRSNGRYGLTQEEADSVRQMQETAGRFFTEYLKWTDAELMDFYKSASKDGYIRWDSCMKKGEALAKEWEENNEM